MKDRLYALIDRHAENEAWLARIFEILQSSEPPTDENRWKNLSEEQKKRIDESILAAGRSEFISNEEVFDSL